MTKQKGYSLVPLNMYFKGSLVKVELGVGKGKKLYDKREDIAKKDAERRMRQHAKNQIQFKTVSDFLFTVFHLLNHNCLHL